MKTNEKRLVVRIPCEMFDKLKELDVSMSKFVRHAIMAKLTAVTKVQRLKKKVS
jgi:hypothetical protein